MILELKSVTKRFGGLLAINDLSMGVPKNCIKALIGPNGSGKTTSFNLITGVYQLTSGSIWYDGREITNMAPHKTVEAGICRTFQNIRLFKKMTALDNVITGMHCRTTNDLLSILLRYRKSRNEERMMREKAMSLLEYFKLDDKSDELSANLPYGHQRLLEIARALASEPKLLLLDEPAAGMNKDEKNVLIDTIRRVRDDFNVSILLVEHDMSLVMTIAEDITVVNFGAVIANGKAEEIQHNEQVIEAYLGREDEEW